MEGYYLIQDEGQDVRIEKHEGTEEELVDKTRKNVWRQTENGIESIENHDFVASQVYWTQDAIRSYLMSVYTAADLDRFGQPVYGNAQRDQAAAKLDELLVTE